MSDYSLDDDLVEMFEKHHWTVVKDKITGLVEKGEHSSSEGGLTTFRFIKFDHMSQNVSYHSLWGDETILRWYPHRDRFRSFSGKRGPSYRSCSLS